MAISIRKIKELEERIDSLEKVILFAEVKKTYGFKQSLNRCPIDGLINCKTLHSFH